MRDMSRSRPFFFAGASSSTTVRTSAFTPSGKCRFSAARALPIKYSASGSRRFGKASVTVTASAWISMSFTIPSATRDLSPRAGCFTSSRMEIISSFVMFPYVSDHWRRASVEFSER